MMDMALRGAGILPASAATPTAFSESSIRCGQDARAPKASNGRISYETRNRFPRSIAVDIVRQAREKHMEPQHWVQHFVMQKMLEAQRPKRDAEFDQLAAYILEKNAPVMEALARSEREDAAMAPEELALKYPNRR